MVLLDQRSRQLNRDGLTVLYLKTVKSTTSKNISVDTNAVLNIEVLSCKCYTQECTSNRCTVFVSPTSQDQLGDDITAIVPRSVAPLRVVIGMNVGTASPVKKPITPPKPLISKG